MVIRRFNVTDDDRRKSILYCRQTTYICITIEGRRFVLYASDIKYDEDYKMLRHNLLFDDCNIVLPLNYNNNIMLWRR